jgi:hypothetical protein
MRRISFLLALAAAAACGDQRAPAEPTAAAGFNAAKQAGSSALLGPLDDAAARIGPALGASADATQARVLLASVRDQARAGKAVQLAGSAVVRNLAAALDRLDAADPGLAAETDAVRLAIAPLR